MKLNVCLAIIPLREANGYVQLQQHIYEDTSSERAGENVSPQEEMRGSAAFFKKFLKRCRLMFYGTVKTGQAAF